MTPKIFNIRIPSAAQDHPQALMTWINSHVMPGVNVNKTDIKAQDFETIYQKFQTKLHRVTSLDTINAYRGSCGHPAMTKLEHTHWITSQSVEIQVTFISEGRFKAVFQLVGASHTPQMSGLEMGYLDLTQFEIGLYYSAGSDRYHLTYRDSEAGHTAVMGSDFDDHIKGLKLFPVFEFEYSQDRTQKEKALTTEELITRFTNAFCEHYSEAYLQSFTSTDQPGAWVGGRCQPKQSVQTLAVQLRAADEFAGSFFKPLLLSAFSVEVPVATGLRIYTRLTFSYGQRVTIMLPPLEVSLSSDEEACLYLLT